MSNVLVTGGAGYVGSVLTQTLQNAGHKVTIFDTFDYGVLPTLPCLASGVQAIRGDIRDGSALAKALKDQNVVINLASIVGAPRCRKYPELAKTTIILGAKNLAWLKTPDQEIINASTGSIYGKIDDICSEETCPNPQSDYGRWKYDAERILNDAGAVSLRFATLFGISPCMRFDLLPNDFVKQAVTVGQIDIYRGSDRRTFLHLRDAVRCYQMMLEHAPKLRGQAFNVGDVKLNMTKMAYAQALQGIFNYNLVVHSGGDDPDCRDYEVNYDKIKKAIGFEASVTLESGIRELVQLVQVSDEKDWPQYRSE